MLSIFLEELLGLISMRMSCFKKGGNAVHFFGRTFGAHFPANVLFSKQGEMLSIFLEELLGLISMRMFCLTQGEMLSIFFEELSGLISMSFCLRLVEMLSIILKNFGGQSTFKCLLQTGENAVHFAPRSVAGHSTFVLNRGKCCPKQGEMAVRFGAKFFGLMPC